MASAIQGPYFGTKIAFKICSLRHFFSTWEIVVEQFHLADLKHRWRDARVSAATSAVDAGDLALLAADDPDGVEVALVRKIPPDRVDEALKRVFDNSRRLALSASRRYSIRFELDDFIGLFQAAQIPCATGSWAKRSHARVSERQGCSFGANREVRMCDWYREAMDGIIMGLGETERIVRHGSQAYGDDGCLDIVFDDAPEAVADLSYAPVPTPMAGHLQQVVHAFKQRGLSLNWDGYRAGTLFYTLTPEQSDLPLCTGKGRAAHGDVIAAVRAVFPVVRVQDSSPLAVYGESTK